MNKIKIRIPKISSNNSIRISHTYPGNYTLAIADSGVNILLANEATPTMVPGLMSNNITARLPDGITMESSHVATLQLSGLTKKAIQIHSYPKIITSPLILLGILCDDGCTITLDQHDMQFQNNGQKISKGTR